MTTKLKEIVIESSYPWAEFIRDAYVALSTLRRRKESLKELRSRLKVSKARIVRDLRKFGINSGGVIYVHSSLKSIGFIQGGPHTVIDALIESVGSKGTVVMPAFSLLNGSMLDTVKSCRIFDPKTTPSTIGLIPETFRRRPGVLRSVHPTHSVCAHGAKAEWITRGHHKCESTFGEGTPYWKMIKLNAKVVGLGVDLAYPTFYHTFEDVTHDFPLEVYEKEYEVKVLDENGEMMKMKVRPHNPNISKTRLDTPKGKFIRKYITDYVASRNALRLGLVGEAHCWLITTENLLMCLNELMQQGITIYTTEQQLPPADRRKKTNLIRSYQSLHSPQEFDYLVNEAEQAKLPASRKGFWDGRNERWIRCQNWNGSDWAGYVAHDWKYALELQEGATIFEMTTGLGLLNHHIAKELNFIHGQIGEDGSISKIPDAYGSAAYEYGLVLSSLALGAKYFKNSRNVLARRCFDDMTKVCEYVQNAFGKLEVTEDHSVILRGYVNSWYAFNAFGDQAKQGEMKRQIEKYVIMFIRGQNADGSFGDPASSLPVQLQEKIDLSLLLAHPIVGLDKCLAIVKRNVDWILSERWIGESGALTWSSDCMDLFFECHQLWFITILRYLKNLSRGAYNYLNYAKNSWLFLTDNNYANIDSFVHNYRHTGAFFSYRVLKENGEIQPVEQGLFKGSYEIGASLWSLALNYDL